MYLSYLLIDVGTNPDRPRPGRLWMRKFYRVHQRLCMAFPTVSKLKDDADFLQPYDPGDLDPRQVHVARGNGKGFLFRVDTHPGGRVVVLVQSAARPNWDYAFHNADYLLAACPEVKEYNPRLQKGQRFRFRLRANPSYKRNGKRLGHMSQEKQRHWLERKAMSGGFEIIDVDPVPEGMRKDFSRGEEHPMSLVSVLFEGTLSITDPQRFQQTLQNGIGSGKGLGFGLLSVAPATG